MIDILFCRNRKVSSHELRVQNFGHCRSFVLLQVNWILEIILIRVTLTNN